MLGGGTCSVKQNDRKGTCYQHFHALELRVLKVVGLPLLLLIRK
jgi:hypothetical protein